MPGYCHHSVNITFSLTESDHIKRLKQHTLLSYKYCDFGPTLRKSLVIRSFVQTLMNLIFREGK